ncbi:conserved hypothetical protein [Rhodococcus jostii RHA1]|uniref:Head-to-tail stopper n=1 Tax=Rhodococcus jostii (strain RHA1) TaxID=101510 RepID=Q0S298_RHOJR|nr:hypothetical protein [Rhodococcus jostii]ABG98338.1 conserved hypothetical protein [Rhodococcus jostii RHA1]
MSRRTDLVTVYPETVVIDDDGNTLTRPGAVGVLTRAVVQTDDSTPSKHRLRLVGYPGQLAAQSAVEWNGQRYMIDGGSPRTAQAEYVMIRK